MRKLLIAAIFLFAIHCKAQTWVYHAMPDSNAFWNFEGVFPCPSGMPKHEFFSIIISGDTLIGGQTYHKLFTPYVVGSSGGSGCGGQSTGYQGAIRQDTALKKTYIFKPWDVSEKLLYDFTMQVGDTLKGIIASVSPDTVVSIDSVLAGGNYRKRWNLTYGISFIEGIGSAYGLLEYSTTGTISTFPYFPFICFSQDGVSIYPNSTTNCELITSVDPLNETEDRIHVFPNPSNGSFTIDVDNLEIKEIQVYDLYGQLIKKEDTDKQANMKIEPLKNGTYILSLVCKDGRRINRKLISGP